MKAKNTTNVPKTSAVPVPTQHSPISRKLGGGVPDEDASKKPPINKSNPWNMDPFVPHYNKPAVSMVSINNEQAAKMGDKNPTPAAAAAAAAAVKTSPQSKVTSINLGFQI